MTIDFTATLDSNGDPWTTTDALAGLTAELGDTYLETIMQLVSTGVIDVEMGPDLDMHAYNSQGRDLTGTTFGAGKVRFVKGVNIADDLERQREDNPVGTFIEIVGIDNATGRAVLPDAASRVAREIAGTGDSSDETVLEALGLAQLNVRLASSDAVGFRVAAIGTDEDAGLYLPGPEGSENGKYWLGDTTTLHTGTGEKDFNQADQRVAAITITHDDAGNLEVTPEVGSPLGEAERRLYDLERRARATSFTERSQDTGQPTSDAAHPDLAVHDALGLATQAELDALAAAAAAADAVHPADTTAAHAASSVGFTPAGSIAATNVQEAIEEVATESGAITDIVDLPTAETDTALVLAPDGVGGVEFRSEGGGGAPPAVSTARVETNQTTTSTSFADLATAGPSVTVDVPASGKVRVSLACGYFPSSGTAIGVIGVALSGANTVAASDSWAAIATVASSGFVRLHVTQVLTGLTPGSTTFKARYRVSGGTGNFSTREISVEPVT